MLHLETDSFREDLRITPQRRSGGFIWSVKQVQRRHARGRGALNGMAVPFGPAQPAALASAWQGVQMRDRVGSAAFPGMVRDQHDCAFAPNVSSVSLIAEAVDGVQRRARQS